MKKWGIAALFVILVAALVIYIDWRGRSYEIEEGDKLVVVSPHPIEFMIPLIQEFENETDITVDLKSMGTSAAIDSIVNDDNVDIMWGGSLLSVGPYIDNFYSYETPNKKDFMYTFTNENSAVTCFSDVPSVLMVNTDLIGDIDILGYKDLLNPALRGKIAFADPGRSSSSFEHLVNMLYAMGDGDPENGWDYVESFISQLDGNLLESSSVVYQGVANGKYAVGLTFEEAAVTMLKSDKHVSIVYMNEGVVMTPDGIYISKNSKRLENAKKFVDFMTSKDAQQYMASDLGRRSVRRDVESSILVVPRYKINNLPVDRNRVIANKDKWIEEFNRIRKEDDNG
ncbi:extracellular solute-binding protein [Butyrivibrio sp. X503]|uniref:extracellular solute-binding protein n=1 Tax=Butyrivibrio sp. X503 TaxID=2364878 RepID=UPI000EAA4398|nr:extracellular solute-binding protein [Butyrivibrio sp. X503]RKM53897.1 extracellular solute-binding protein [Butyrivibrio sp. X503]